MTPLRLLPPAGALACALALAACGGSSHSGAASGPLSTDLSYFPSGSPFVMTVDTAPNGPAAKQLQKLQAQNPDETLAKAALFQELAKAGIDYNRDVKPLLGTPLALGIGASQVSGNSTPFLAVWQTNSATALGHLIADLKQATKAGSHDGAAMYQIGQVALAVKGPLLLASNDAANLTAALDRHQTGGGFTAAEYDADTQGLDSGAMVTMVGDLTSALDTPKAAQARRVPWVSAIKGFGVSLTGSPSTVTMKFRLDTSGRSLTDGQLPMAGGSTAPALTLGSGAPIAAGLHDPAQVWTFVKSAEQAADPAGYRKLLAHEKQVKSRTGVDVDSLMQSLTGDLQVSSDLTTTIARVKTTSAGVADFEKLLARPGSGTTSSSLGGGFYALHQSDGTTLTAGAVGTTLLLGKATVAQEKQYAAASASQSSGSGAAAFQIAVGPLIRMAMARDGQGDNPFAGQIASMLGDLTGSVQASTGALTGSATLHVAVPGTHS